MTKSELKEIIKECYSEIMNENNNDIVEESVDINAVDEDSLVIESDEYDVYCITEARAYLEAFIYQEGVLTEADTFTNMATLHKALKDAKTSSKEAKTLIKEDKVKEAKKKIDDAIENLKKAKDEINSNNSLVISIFTSLVYLFAPFTDVAFEIYARIMGTKESDERTASVGLRVARKITRIPIRDMHFYAKSSFKYGLYKMANLLGIGAFITAIIALIKQHESIKNNNQDKNSGVLETKSIMLIDNYIGMLEKLKSNLK